MVKQKRMQIQVHNCQSTPRRQVQPTPCQRQPVAPCCQPVRARPRQRTRNKGLSGNPGMNANLAPLMTRHQAGQLTQSSVDQFQNTLKLLNTMSYSMTAMSSGENMLHPPRQSDESSESMDDVQWESRVNQLERSSIRTHNSLLDLKEQLCAVQEDLERLKKGLQSPVAPSKMPVRVVREVEVESEDDYDDELLRNGPGSPEY